MGKASVYNVADIVLKLTSANFSNKDIVEEGFDVLDEILCDSNNYYTNNHLILYTIILDTVFEKAKNSGLTLLLAKAKEVHSDSKLIQECFSKYFRV